MASGAKALAEEVVGRLAASYGTIDGFLRASDLYQLLVATVLSAQCTDARVNEVTPALFARWPDARALARARVGDVEAAIKTCGLYKTKAKNLVAAATALVERHGGEVPDGREALEALPGVGRKTASVVLQFGHGAPAFPVDTHCFRVANRIGIARAKDARGVEEQLSRRVAKGDWAQAHRLLILHGRRVCKAQGPRCDACALGDLCRYKKARDRLPRPVGRLDAKRGAYWCRSCRRYAKAPASGEKDDLAFAPLVCPRCASGDLFRSRDGRSARRVFPDGLSA